MDTPSLTFDSTETAPGVFHAAHGSAHSWPEDFGGENGKYQNECVTCKTLFIGHKQRVVCRVCAEAARKRWEAMTEEERQESTARTAREIAEWYAQNTKPCRGASQK